MKVETIDGWDLRYAECARCPTRNGGELYFERYGSGPPLLLLNNFFTIAPAWRNFTTRLSETCSIVAYDLQNQGASSQPGGSFPFSGHVEDIVDLLDHLEIEHAYLLGTSISTLIARDAATAYPERVRGLVLVGPAFSPFGGLRLRLLLKDWRARLEDGGPYRLFTYLYPLILSDRSIEEGGRATYLGLRERFLALNSHEQIEACLAGAASIEERDSAHGVDCPTFIVIGEADYLWSPSTLAAACAMLPQTDGIVIPEAGHLPFAEQTEAFETAVATFITTQEEARAAAQASGS
jgi:3-oxoadipate enol-lactonase